MKTIQLTRGLTAMVDDEDYDRLNQHKWFAAPSGAKGLHYAARMPWIPGIGQKQHVWMHREICGGIMVDHIDRNGLNNQKSNLRPCTVSENVFNRGKHGKSSKYKGVCWDKIANKWAVFISKNKKARLVGRFGDELMAALAYDAAAIELHGQFAATNKSLNLYQNT